MSDRDELIFLVHMAAEIEHMLLVQYLYAAYSAADTSIGRQCRDVVAGIAREEMGHLLCLQNMLIALGAPLNFDRKTIRSTLFYPFPFKLEPLSVHSLAKYVFAEMPAASDIPSSLSLISENLSAMREFRPEERG